MNIETKEFLIRSVRPNPENHFQKIEFIGEIENTTVSFDPFVSCHLEWYQAHLYIGKDVKFLGWKNESGCYLVSDIVEVK